MFSCFRFPKYFFFIVILGILKLSHCHIIAPSHFFYTNKKNFTYKIHLQFYIVKKLRFLFFGSFFFYKITFCSPRVPLKWNLTIFSFSSLILNMKIPIRSFINKIWWERPIEWLNWSFTEFVNQQKLRRTCSFPKWQILLR